MFKLVYFVATTLSVVLNDVEQVIEFQYQCKLINIDNICFFRAQVANLHVDQCLREHCKE